MGTPFGLRDLVTYEWEGTWWAGVVIELDCEKDLIEIYFKERGSGFCRTRLSSLLACGLRVVEKASDG